jgi:hypothetical protein
MLCTLGVVSQSYPSVAVDTPLPLCEGGGSTGNWCVTSIAVDCNLDTISAVVWLSANLGTEPVTLTVTQGGSPVGNVSTTDYTGVPTTWTAVVAAGTDLSGLSGTFTIDYDAFGLGAHFVTADKDYDCPAGGGPTGGGDDGAAARAAEEARIAAWRASSQELDLTMVGAPAYSTNPGMNLQIGRMHKADLGAGVTEFGYFSEGIYVPLGWHKIDWLGNHYAVPDVDPILSVDQFMYALSLVGWYDGGGEVAPTGPGAAPAEPVGEGAPAGPAANALDLALRGGTPKKTDLGGGLLEFGVWKPDGGYTVLGWAQYDAWGNLMNMAVPDVNPTITRDQFMQFLASEPSFG